MPNRILKESINESRDLTSCTFFAQDLFKRLITYADDYGRFNADPQIMIARLYPRELSIVDISDLMDAIIELVGVGKIAFYTAHPRHEVFGCFPKWDEHQRIRDSKKKAPDPTDTTVNDWYYRRFIPIDMKAAIIERDNFKCQICGKHIAESVDAKKLVKMCTGSFHFDHIVPCNQGGRATYENIRLTCPKCNQSRRKAFDFDEILQFAPESINTQEFAASCRDLPPNPIQSNVESESNPNTNSADKPRRFIKPTVEEVTEYCNERGNKINGQNFVDFYESKGWKVGGSPMKDWKAAVRTWEQRDKAKAPEQPKTKHFDYDENGKIVEVWR